MFFEIVFYVLVGIMLLVLFIFALLLHRIGTLMKYEKYDD